MGYKDYTVREDYFETWSHDMAYVLGFIVADGNIRRDGYYVKVEVAPKDVSVLQFMCDQITPDYTLKYTMRGSEVRWYPSSKRLKQSLLEKGVVPSKSGKERVPPDLPNEFLWDFIRGYFDGDGCVEDCRVATTCHSKTFLEELLCLTKCGSIRPDRMNFKWTIERKDEIRYFFDQLYASGTFWLNRKYQLFEHLLIRPEIYGKFSVDEDLFIISNHGNMTRREMAVALGRNSVSVKNRLRQLRKRGVLSVG